MMPVDGDHEMFPLNPYKGKYTISNICCSFDHTRCISANYQWVATSDRFNITLHKLLTGAPSPWQLKGHTGYVTTLFFHPSKSCLFSGSCDTTIRYWDIYSSKVIGLYTGHTSIITNISANEKYLASASMDETVRIFAIKNGLVMWIYKFELAPIAVTLGKEPDIYLGMEDGTFLKTDIKFSENLKEKEVVHAHGGRLTCFLLDTPFLVTGGFDGYVRVWHCEYLDANAIASFDHNGLYISAVALSFMKVLTTADDGILRIWDIYTSSLNRKIVVNISRRPILGMVCLEIYDHTKIIINNEDGLKVIEFSYDWAKFQATCKLKTKKEPRYIRGLKRIITIKPDEVFSKPQFELIPKESYDARESEKLFLRNAALPSIVADQKGDVVTLKETPIVSRAAMTDHKFLLFPRIMPETTPPKSPVVKRKPRKESKCNFYNIPKPLLGRLPRSTKGFLPAVNPSKSYF